MGWSNATVIVAMESMTPTRTPLWLATVPAALLLASCSGSASPEVVNSAVAPATQVAQASTQASTTTQASTATSSSAAAQNSAVPQQDLTAAGLAAIATAEAAGEGRAYAIDDQDEDGTWEVDVLMDSGATEYTISADGAQVVKTEPEDLDSDERAALANATVTLTQAITTAVEAGGQPLDDADFDDESGVWAWEVSLQTRDTDIVIDPNSGGVISS